MVFSLSGKSGLFVAHAHKCRIWVVALYNGDSSIVWVWEKQAYTCAPPSAAPTSARHDVFNDPSGAKTYMPLIFFLDKGSPGLCIKWCTHPFYWNIQRSKYDQNKDYNHGSAMVATWTNQRNKQHETRLAILYPITVPSSSSPKNPKLQQLIALSNQILALVLRKRESP
jgi:hypothetical protein